jgi:hypothetical protein
MALKAGPGIASPQILSLGKISLSIKATFKPLFLNVSAAAHPAGPAPIIAISKCVFNIVKLSYF